MLGKLPVCHSLNRNGEVMPDVLMYSTRVCPYCVMAEKLLQKKGVQNLQKILIDVDPAKREEMMTRTGRRTVPQIISVIVILAVTMI